LGDKQERGDDDAVQTVKEKLLATLIDSRARVTERTRAGIETRTNDDTARWPPIK